VSTIYVLYPSGIISQGKTEKEDEKRRIQNSEEKRREEKRREIEHG
jgi:hypothetical protein